MLRESDVVVWISAINQHSYCSRRCGLIYQDNEFLENAHTMRGQAVHGKADDPGFDTPEGCRSERSLPVWSNTLGLVGKCDVVEFYPDGAVFPVEYKSGKKRFQINDDLQLAAQALCLEEMLGVSIPKGAVYYYRSRRRREVAIDETLRARVKEVIEAIRVIMQSEHLPPPVNDARCRECSLHEICQPEMATWQPKSRAVLQTLYSDEIL